jgi:hypothetical protein
MRATMAMALRGKLTSSGQRGILLRYTSTRRNGRLSRLVVGETTRRVYHQISRPTSKTTASHGQAPAAADRRLGPAVVHHSGAYLQTSHPPTAKSTRREATASKVTPTSAAVRRVRVLRRPANRAGSPPSRMGVKALAASPKAFVINASPKVRRLPSPCMIH